MQSELSRSRFAQETLEQSTAALADLGEKYTDLNTLLSKSRSLVTTLLKSQKSDTWYLETTLYILITTVIWLIFRRWLYGPITWFIVWPLKLLFKVLFAVIPATGAASSTLSIPTAQQPSTSLIVQPSATDRPPKRVVNTNQPPPYVRVGGGGRGYWQDPSPPGGLSEEVRRMAEQSQQTQDHPQLREHHHAEGESGPVVRGDGTVLPDRPSDRPVNPKKKVWDEDVESAKHAEVEAEKSQTEQPRSSGIRKRDEL
jgi:protein transport protein SEC20